MNVSKAKKKRAKSVKMALGIPHLIHQGQQLDSFYVTNMDYCENV